jgi:hypothetical protein
MGGRVALLNIPHPMVILPAFGSRNGMQYNVMLLLTCS